tara:strand:- start:690 stop:2180 length:1491 start_codon:yes stop_codon:yes gene_type:complete
MKDLLDNFAKNKQYHLCTLTYGHFSIIHQGHIRYLKYAKNLKGKLLIALIGNSNNNEYRFTQEERAEGLELLGLADGIILLKDKELDEVVEKLNPQNLILGKEFQNCKEETINNVIKHQINKNKKVYFHAGEVNYFSDNLLQNSEKKIINKRKEEFINVCKKQGINKDDLLFTLNNLREARVAVIGDTIVDQYAACEPIGLSAEAPVVVVREISVRNFIGGAAIVAKHINSLGAKVDLLSIVGDDQNGMIVKEDLIANGISDNLVVDISRPTTFKKRYVVENQKLFRVSRLESNAINSNIENELIKKLELIAPKVDCLVISDFVYGVITTKLIEKIKKFSKKHNIKICGDLQCSSQIGKITKFKEFTLLCPNEKEARIAIEDNEIGLEKLSLKIMENTKSEKLIMKLGSNGFLSYMRNNQDKNFISQAFPALSANPVDVTGAGDSLLALLSTGIATDQDFMRVSALGCCISSIAVNNMGNLPISYNEIEDYLNEIM